MSRRPTYPAPGYYTDPRQIPQPYPQPEPFNAAGQSRNPAGTVPFPAPKDMPLGLWSGVPTVLQFSASSDPSYTRVTSWTAPVFDLRPSYRNARGQSDTGNAIPIWKPSSTNPGAGGKLWVQLSPMVQAVSLTSMEIFYEELGHIQDGNNIQLISPEADITDQYVPGQEAMVLGFWPPGDGYPLRFWTCRITIKIGDTLASDPVFTIQGCYY